MHWETANTQSAVCTVLLRKEDLARRKMAAPSPSHPSSCVLSNDCLSRNSTIYRPLPAEDQQRWAVFLAFEYVGRKWALTAGIGCTLCSASLVIYLALGALVKCFLWSFLQECWLRSYIPKWVSCWQLVSIDRWCKRPESSGDSWSQWGRDVICDLRSVVAIVSWVAL